MQEYKAYFVTHYLKPLLQAAEVNVKAASYREEDDRELVRLTYIDGSTEDINVSWDSLIAITRDVIKNL